MPKPDGDLWRHCRAEMDLTSDQAAELLGITGGALRQIETNVKPAGLNLAYRASRLYKCDVKALIVADGDETPDPKKDEKVEPKVEPTAPPGRKNGKGDRRGPRRASDMRAAS